MTFYVLLYALNFNSNSDFNMSAAPSLFVLPLFLNLTKAFNFVQFVSEVTHTKVHPHLTKEL